jgi:hypothetical protein
MTSQPLDPPNPTRPGDDAPVTDASRAYAATHGPKTPTPNQAAALLLRSERARTKAAHARGLKALDQMALHLDRFYRWRVVAAMAPSGKLMQEANQNRDHHSRRAADYLTVVQAALGLTEDNDPAKPTKHWDRGAMED